MDALRCLAMLVVVAIHSALAYLVIRLPDLPWVVRDPGAARVLDHFCCWGVFTMPLFFLISGFFAAKLYETRGPKQFLIDRTRRVLLPLVLGGAAVLPFCLAIWTFGWYVTGRCKLRHIQILWFSDPELQANWIGPSHLWFLEYLYILTLGYWLLKRSLDFVQGVGGRWASGGGVVERILLSPWRPLSLAVPTAIVLWCSCHWIGRDTATDFRNSFIPCLFRLLYQAIYFVGGVCLYRVRDRHEQLLPFSSLYVILSIPALICRDLLHWEDLERGVSPSASVAVAVFDGLFISLSVFGFLGLFIRFFNQRRALVSYLSDASYWVYLVHLPIVGLGQLAFYRFSIPVPLKFLCVLTIALSLSLLSYQTLVRYRLVGTWLHGRRYRAAPPANVLSERECTIEAMNLSASKVVKKKAA